MSKGELRDRFDSPAVRSGVPGRPRRDRPPGPARARAPQRARRTGRPGVRGHARRPVRRPPAGGRDAGRRGHGGTRDRRAERLGAGSPRVPAIAVRARHVHRDERPRPRASRGDGLDRRRGGVRPAHLAPLPPPDPRRTDRVRRLELPRHRRPGRRAALRVQRRGRLGARARLPPLVPRVRRRPAGDLLGRADRRGAACICRSSGRCRAGSRTTGSGSPGTGSARVTSAGRSCPGSRSVCEDEATTLPISDGDRQALPARAPVLDRGAPSSAARSSGGTTAWMPVAHPGWPTELLARLPRRLGYNLGP